MALSLGTASAQTSSSSKKRPSGEQNPPAKGQNRSAAPVKAQESRGGPSAEDPFIAIASQLASPLGEKKEVSVGVGNFAFQDTDLLSPFSALLRDELEVELNQTTGFKVVTRDRIADLQNEGKFQMRDLLEPGTAVEKVSVK